MNIVEIIRAFILGIVEGITEWLPISSTGHMILVNSFIKYNDTFTSYELFNYVIQFGAILAVVTMFFKKLNPFSPSKSKEEKKGTWDMWFKVIVACLPAAIIGLLLDSFMEKFESPVLISLMLIIYGILFIVVENIPLTNGEGEEMGILRDTDFVFDADSLESDEEYITLYFSDENGDSLTSEVRKIKVPKGEVMEKLVVSELLEGPKNGKNLQVIPSGTKIISVETKEGVCFVNLSKEFITKHPGVTSAEIMTVYSIVNSLTELVNVNKVQFLIDGEIKELFNHIVINEPLERDTSYIIK